MRPTHDGLWGPRPPQTVFALAADQGLVMVWNFSSTTTTPLVLTYCLDCLRSHPRLDRVSTPFDRRPS